MKKMLKKILYEVDQELGVGEVVTSKTEPCIICGSCRNKTPLSLMTLSLSGHPSKKDETYMYNKRYVVSSGNKANWSWPNRL